MRKLSKKKIEDIKLVLNKYLKGNVITDIFVGNSIENTLQLAFIYDKPTEVSNCLSIMMDTENNFHYSYTNCKEGDIIRNEE